MLIRGIYVPVATFFHADEDQSLDIETHKEHILWMARAGVHGFLVHGSTGEAVSLTLEEKIQVCGRLPKIILLSNMLTDLRGAVDRHYSQDPGRERLQ